MVLYHLVRIGNFKNANKPQARAHTKVEKLLHQACVLKRLNSERNKAYKGLNYTQRQEPGLTGLLGKYAIWPMCLRNIPKTPLGLKTTQPLKAKLLIRTNQHAPPHPKAYLMLGMAW